MLRQTIIEKREKVRFFLSSLLIPAKNSDVLSLHQKTIAISIWIILILLLVSTAIEVINIRNHWLVFTENLMIGIVCSSVVVVVTAFLQFKAEQEKRIKEYNLAVYKLLSCVRACLFESNISFSKEQDLLDSLYEERDRYIDTGLELRWYNSRKMHEYYDVIIHVLPFLIPLLEKSPVRSLADYQEKVTTQMYSDAVNSAIAFSADYVPKDTKNRFETLKCG